VALVFGRAKVYFIAMWRIRFDNGTGPGQWFNYVIGQPNWVAKWALIATVAVIVVPLMVLAIAGLAVGLVVFVALALIVRIAVIIRTVFDGLWPGSRSDGRRNVRVIDRD